MVKKQDFGILCNPIISVRFNSKIQTYLLRIKYTNTLNSINFRILFFNILNFIKLKKYFFDKKLHIFAIHTYNLKLSLS